MENEHLMLREAVGNQGGEPICCFALRMRVWCGCQPEQIGKRHVHEYLEQSMAETTRRDHYYAIRLLWEMMRRCGLHLHRTLRWCVLRNCPATGQVIWRRNVLCRTVAAFPPKTICERGLHIDAGVKNGPASHRTVTIDTGVPCNRHAHCHLWWAITSTGHSVGLLPLGSVASGGGAACTAAYSKARRSVLSREVSSLPRHMA